MDCNSEAASHYAGCSCHEEHWRAQLATLESRLHYYQTRAVDAEGLIAGEARRAREAEAELAAAEAEVRDLRGAMNADDERLRAASERVFGDFAFGCDTAMWLADEVMGLRQMLDVERAVREKAEAERDEAHAKNATLALRVAGLEDQLQDTVADSDALRAEMAVRETDDKAVAAGALSTAEAERDLAWARCASLERQRSGFDCRFAGPYAEMSGSHCPSGKPCQRCELEAAEARVAELEEALREIADDFKAYVEYRGKVVSEWGSYNRARRALEVK